MGPHMRLLVERCFQSQLTPTLKKITDVNKIEHLDSIFPPVPSDLITQFFAPYALTSQKYASLLLEYSNQECYKRGSSFRKQQLRQYCQIQSHTERVLCN